MNQALFLLRLANFIVILGSGITWTGLSFDLSERYNDPRFMAFMQSLSVIASFIGPFIGLWLNARATLRFIVIATEIIAAISCSIVFIMIQGYEFYGLLEYSTLFLFISFILLSGSVNGLFIEPLYAKLVERRDGSDANIRTEFANFACFGILSKLLGMSIGPSLFALTGQYSLLINAISFVASAVFFWMAMNKVPKDIGMISMPAEEITIFKRSTWKYITGLPLFETAIANSMIFIVVLAMSTQAMTLEATPMELSFFWFGATGCAFLSHFLLSRFSKMAQMLFKLEKQLGFLQIIPIFCGLLTTNITILLISQWVFSLLNPLATNQSRSDFYQTYGKGSNKILDAYAMRSVLTNSIVLFFSLIVSIAGTEKIVVFLASITMGLVLLRWGIAKRISLKKQLAEV